MATEGDEEKHMEYRKPVPIPFKPLPDLRLDYREPRVDRTGRHGIMRIATWNVLNRHEDFIERFEQCCRFLYMEDVDVAMLQEIPLEFRRDARDAAFRSGFTLTVSSMGSDGNDLDSVPGILIRRDAYIVPRHMEEYGADDGEHGEVYTRLQYDLFLDAVRRLEGEGIHFEIRHCCNSAATTEYREMQLDACRVGICIYGLKSSKEVKNQDDLKPVMSLKTIVSTVKVIDSGTTVSYGRTFTADKPMKIAVVAIGYADGYPRILSDAGARMIVNGQYAPVIGRICMDMCMLDVTDIENVKDGDIVTVMGVDAASGKEISADELAEKAQTINYEITCYVSKRVPRVYLKNGKKQSVKNYIS